MPFEKGKSGNPNGRPKGARDKTKLEIEEIARQHAPEAMKRLMDLVKNPKHHSHFAAIKELLDRGYGKPRQETDNNVSGDLNIILHKDGHSPAQ